MAGGIRHIKTSGIANPSDASLVGGADWDAPHIFDPDVQTISRLGPQTVNFGTANFVNPSDDGPVLFTIPAGAFFKVVMFVTTTFDEAGVIFVKAGQASGSNATEIAEYGWMKRGNAFVARETTTYQIDTASNVSQQLSQWNLALQESVVCAAFYPDGSNPAAGSATFYALVATAA